LEAGAKSTGIMMEEKDVAQRNRKVHGYRERKGWSERDLLLIS